MPEARWLRLCDAGALRDGGDGIVFDVEVDGRAATGFVVRHRGGVVGYLNRCAHVAMELDWQRGRFLDDSGDWLVCATHGAMYAPGNGRCAGGPCAGRGGLRALEVIERDTAVYWRPDDVVRAPPAA
jgi:nitrite reductase/ring-hydroxylating ferredoxin subunit